MSYTLSDKNYIAIADWMLELKLNTRELLTFALIYSFSQDQMSFYYGSLEYLASWLGVSDRTNAVRYLKPLVERGLVKKTEVRAKNNQKACLYQSVVDHGKVLDNPDVDYLIIQPWMLQKMHLNGKDLLLYALVHGYSRRESDNVCRYNKDYFAKWLQCRSDNVSRQIKQAITKGLIKEAGENEYIAVIPTEIAFPQTDNTPLKSEDIDFTQIDNTFPHSDNTQPLKLTTNNLNNNLKNNLNVVVKERVGEASRTEDESIFVQAEEINKELLNYYDELSDEEKSLLWEKMLNDSKTLARYSSSKIDISRIMRAYAMNMLRMMIAHHGTEGERYIWKAEELLLSTLTSRRYKNKTELINGLSDEKMRELLFVALDLATDGTQVQKTKQAYFVGVMDNSINRQTEFNMHFMPPKEVEN